LNRIKRSCRKSAHITKRLKKTLLKEGGRREARMKKKLWGAGKSGQDESA